MKWGEEWPARHDLSSLRLLGTVGEPINPEAWIWYHRNIGRSRCPIVDTWWQTETGMIMITPLPGVTHAKPGSATVPFPDVSDVINVAGHRIGTWEVESALVDHPAVAEAAVIGRVHAVKGQAISAFVILKEGHRADPAAMESELKEHVARKIGALARPGVPLR